MRLEKKAIIDEIKGRIEDADFVFLADCRGLTVEQISALRERLGSSSSELRFVKNAFFGLAADALGWDSMGEYLSGPTAMIVGRDDAAGVAKVLRSFRKDNELPVVKGGRLSGRRLTAAEVDMMADIPSREILLGLLAGTLAAPMTQLAGVMSRKVASLLYVLGAVADKKQ